MVCHYWYFKDIDYKFEPHVCNKCYDISMMAYELKNIAIVIVKGIDYRCVLWNMTKNDAINMLGNSELDDKGTLWIGILVQIKTVRLEELILETLILVLMVSGIKSQEKKLMS